MKFSSGSRCSNGNGGSSSTHCPRRLSRLPRHPRRSWSGAGVWGSDAAGRSAAKSFFSARVGGWRVPHPAPELRVWPPVFAVNQDHRPACPSRLPLSLGTSPFLRPIWEGEDLGAGRRQGGSDDLLRLVASGGILVLRPVRPEFRSQAGLDGDMSCINQHRNPRCRRGLAEAAAGFWGGGRICPNTN